jgi:hypothetical protein
LEQFPTGRYFLFAFAADGIGIAISWERPRTVPTHYGGRTIGGRTIIKVGKQAKEGVLVSTNNEMYFRTALSIKDCVRANCCGSGDRLRSQAAGELR